MEDGIVESLVALRDEEPREREPMFVFPLSLMASPWRTLDEMAAVRCGEVARVPRARPDGESP